MRSFPTICAICSRDPANTSYEAKSPQRHSTFPPCCVRSSWRLALPYIDRAYLQNRKESSAKLPGLWIALDLKRLDLPWFRIWRSVLLLLVGRRQGDELHWRKVRGDRPRWRPNNALDDSASAPAMGLSSPILHHYWEKKRLGRGLDESALEEAIVAATSGRVL